MLPLFAVHLSDGVVAPPVAFAAFAWAAGLLWASAWRMHEDEVPRVGVLTAAFFVASQVHLPTGVGSVHLLLNGLVGLVLGRLAGLAVAVGLFLQTFLFLHGGLTALGLNVCVYAAPAMAGGVLFRRARRARVLSDYALGFLFGFGTALATVLMNFAVLMLAPAIDLGNGPWVALGLNLTVVPVEAVACGFAVQYLGKARPDWLGDHAAAG